jgi:hypothetical protein
LCGATSLYNPPVHRAALIVLLWTIAIGPARADLASDALEQISKCSSISDPAQRLQCFDRYAPRAKDALQPKPADFGNPVTPRQEVEQVAATVRELSKTVRGRAVFALDNGQVWRQLDSDDVNVPDPAPGSVVKVTIARGAMGSYTLTMEGRNGLIRVRRVE